MLPRQEKIQRFLWGMSILNSYISFNSELNYHDINIVSENFMRDMMNILYNINLESPTNKHNPGYDLISGTDKIVVQISSTTKPEKIKHSFEELKRIIDERESLKLSIEDIEEDIEEEIEKNGFSENPNVASLKLRQEEFKRALTNLPDLKDYTVKFLILSDNSTSQKNYQGIMKTGYPVPESLKFTPAHDIIDLRTLAVRVNDLDEDTLSKLDVFMSKNANLFIRRIEAPAPADHIDTIIYEYAANYEGPLFRHTYVKDTQVKLCNLYIDPAYVGNETGVEYSRNMVSLLSQFLWQDMSLRMLFIEGDAAVGKTSLISWLCYHYRKIGTEKESASIGKAIFLSSKLVCVRLRELDFGEKQTVSVSPILSYLGFDSLTDFQRDYSDATIVLDGIDEISMINDGISSSFVLDFLLNVRKNFKKNKLIVTGRPHFFNIDDLRTNTFKIQYVALQHFSQPMREEWIAKYEECGESIPSKTKEYILNLDHSAAEGVADTPLALYLLVSCEIREELQGNRWALYHEIFKNAIMKTEYNENFSVGTGHPAYKNLDIIYDIVCKISFKMFQNSNAERYYITSNELDKIIGKIDLKGIPTEWVRQCCVLCAYWKSNSNVGALEFYHNNIRDFFFCEYIYDALFGKCNEKVFQDLALPEYIQIVCKIFQYGYISGTTWEQAFEFLYLRLKYMQQKSRRNILGELPPSNRFFEVFTKLFTERNIYAFEYDGLCYSSIKRVLINTTLLIRLVCQIWIDMDVDNNRVCLWKNDADYKLLTTSGIFLDWHEMFLHSIKISSSKVISIGSHIDLSKLELHHLALDTADFSYSLFEHASFAKTSLQRASFSNSNLLDCDFSNCDLQGTIFRSASLSNINFAGAKLSGVIFDDATITNCNLENAVFENCSFINTEIDHSVLSGTTYKECKIISTTFNNLKLNGANFSKTIALKDIVFSNCSLIEAIFSKAVLSGVTFSICDLTRGHFYYSRLKDVRFSQGVQMNIDFEHATFTNTDLSDIDSISCTTKHAKFIM